MKQNDETTPQRCNQELHAGRSPAGALLADARAVTALAGENRPLPAGEKTAGGVGVSAPATITGVAIYSGDLPEKKSNAYGVSGTPTLCAGVGCDVCDEARAEKIAGGMA